MRGPLARISLNLVGLVHGDRDSIQRAQIDTGRKRNGPQPRKVVEKGGQLRFGYQMGLRPQTLYGIVDSPIGLASYFLDHDAWSYALISRVFAGEKEGLSRDDVLDNITLAWLTNTAISSARLYWENKLTYFGVKGVSVPVAVSSFPDEIDLCPRSWAERAYPKLIHYNKLNKGGHFAAWEQPELFVKELRDGFASLRPHA
jgi:pimeloyl-ACP methyl ester carboxylesterase